MPDRATVIFTNGGKTVLEDRPGPMSLSWCQQQVGGYIEMVPGPPGQMIIVNEEGLLRDLPPNPVASAIARRPLVGPVIILEGKAKLR